MFELFTHLLANIESVVMALGYAGIALAMLMVAPELVLPFAGFLVNQGRLSIEGVVLAGTAGAVSGQVGLYALAFWMGEQRMRGFLRRYGRWLLLREQDLDWVLVLFKRHDCLLLIGGRCVPSVRSLVSLPAGVGRMPLARFFLFTAVGTMVWNTLLVIIGMILGRHWEQFLTLLAVYEQGVWMLLAFFMMLFLVRRLNILMR